MVICCQTAQHYGRLFGVALLTKNASTFWPAIAESPDRLARRQENWIFTLEAGTRVFPARWCKVDIRRGARSK
ncbi:hypothetical protein ACNKHM_16870 [Shigella sonnei]